MITLKKIDLIITIIIFTIFLSGCQVNKTYDDLNTEFETHLENYREVYEKRIDFFNAISTQVAPAVVIVEANVTPINRIVKGSGVVFSQSETHYHVLTNHHVIYASLSESATYRIQDYLGNFYNASLLYTNSDFDLAILAFPKISRQIRTISFNDEDPEVKENIAIMGYPNIKMMAITMGTVINYDTIVLPQSLSVPINIDFEVMVTYAPVKPGSSGSLVINEDHELVGIVFSAYIPLHKDIAEATFIIPVSQVSTFIQIAIAGGWL